MVSSYTVELSPTLKQGAWPFGSLSPSFTGCQPAPEAGCSYLSDEVLWSARDKPPEKGAAGSSREEPNPQQLGDGNPPADGL